MPLVKQIHARAKRRSMEMAEIFEVDIVFLDLNDPWTLVMP